MGHPTGTHRPVPTPASCDEQGVVGGTGTKGFGNMSHPLRVGVIGAGRVGAVLAHALDSAGHDIVAAAGESDASRSRAEQLLPGVPLLKPSSVARQADL